MTNEQERRLIDSLLRVARAVGIEDAYIEHDIIVPRRASYVATGHGRVDDEVLVRFASRIADAVEEVVVE